jgi:hypothetical protein
MFCKAVMNWHFLGQNMNRVRNSRVKKDTQTRSVIISAGWTTVSFLGIVGSTVVVFESVFVWFHVSWIFENVKRSYNVPKSFRNSSCFETRNIGCVSAQNEKMDRKTNIMEIHA